MTGVRFYRHPDIRGGLPTAMTEQFAAAIGAEPWKAVCDWCVGGHHALCAGCTCRDKGHS